LAEKTNACCVYIFKEDVPPIEYKKGSIVYDNRVIKPVVKEVYIDNEKIVGLKKKNECCYLTKSEKRFNTKNGCFEIYKESGVVLDGLTAEELNDMDISIHSMKKIL